MIKLLLGLLFFFGLILLSAGFFGISLIRFLFGFGKHRPKKSENDESSRNYSKPSSHDKIFGDNEGEYVDFEEINENPSARGEHKKL